MKIQDFSTNIGKPAPSAFIGDDAERLRVLESFEPDGLEDDPELALIVRFAAHLCEVPVSQVTLVERERQRFLVREGIEERETPREMSFCAHTLGSPAMLEVHDAATDPRFAANPLVTGWPKVRFYAGQPLISEEGASLGTICVVDLKPRPEGLTALQREGLSVLAQAVMRRLNARRHQLAATRDLDRSSAEFLLLANSMPDIAWAAEADGTVRFLNDRWYDFTGANRSAEMNNAALIHPEDQARVFELWQKALDNGEPFEAQCRLRYNDGSWRWVITRSDPAFDTQGKVTGWFGTSTDIDEFHRLSESRELLSTELSHRIKNIFAVVIGLAMLKARAAPEHLEFAQDLASALRSLASANEFVRVSGSPVEENLHALLAALFSPYGDGAGHSRVQVSGANCAINTRAATPLALIFHELATNSAKYGALSSPDGQVDLSIAENDDNFVIDWLERGGPPVDDTGKHGFGSRLVDMAVKGQLQGSWKRNFAPDGLTVELTLAKAELEG